MQCPLLKCSLRAVLDKGSRITAAAAAATAAAAAPATAAAAAAARPLLTTAATAAALAAVTAAALALHLLPKLGAEGGRFDAAHLCEAPRRLPEELRGLRRGPLQKRRPNTHPAPALGLASGIQHDTRHYVNSD
jgi:hypothetical protein